MFFKVLCRNLFRGSAVRRPTHTHSHNDREQEKNNSKKRKNFSHSRASPPPPTTAAPHPPSTRRKTTMRRRHRSMPRRLFVVVDNMCEGLRFGPRCVSACGGVRGLFLAARIDKPTHGERRVGVGANAWLKWGEKSGFDGFSAASASVWLRVRLWSSSSVFGETQWSWCYLNR